MSGSAKRACCCGCCGADCILVEFTDWPAQHGSDPVINPLTFLNGVTWKVPRVSACTFARSCGINETIDGVHYISFTILATVTVHLTGEMFIQSLSAGMLADDGSSLFIFPPIPFTQADLPGCDQTINAIPYVPGEDPVGSTYPDASMTVEFARGGDCDDPDCAAEDGCETCCPDTTCYLLTVHYTDTLAIPDPVSYSAIIPMSQHGASACLWSGSCFKADPDGYQYNASMHIVCDDDGNPTLLQFIFNDVKRSLMFAVTTPTPVGCLASTSLTPDLIFPADAGITVDSITIEGKVECDDVENCLEPPHPGACPEDCFTCTEACGERCWTGATLTIAYDLELGECGSCASWGDPPFGDGGCRKCSSCQPTFDPLTGHIDKHGCADYNVFSDGDCLGHDPPGFIYCDEGCTEDGGGGSSPCSWIDFSGSIELAMTGIVGDEIHFGATLTIPTDNTIVFDVWYDCGAERWYARVVFNDRCVFTGDLNGSCETFPGIPNLGGTDSGITGGPASCELVGQLGGADVEFADYTCPEA